MTDDRPRPEYGEYATPEQQAAAMGRTYTPPPAPGSGPIILSGSPIGAQSGPGGAPSVPEEQPFRLGGNVIDRFATIFQLGVGLVFLINSNYFQFAEDYNIGVSEFGFGKPVPTSLDSYGWLLLTANIVVFLGAAVWAYSRLRRARLAFFVPIVGFVVFTAIVTTLLAIVIQS